MSRICQITGISYQRGNHVSHSKRRVPRRFMPNLFNKKFYIPEDDCWVQLKVSAQGIRLIDKIGVKAALKRAEKKGIIKLDTRIDTKINTKSEEGLSNGKES